MQIRSALKTLFTPDSGLTGLDLRSSLESPSIPLASPQAFSLVFGGEPTVAGEVINEQNALTISSVFAAVRIIAESTACIPVKVYAKSATGKTEDPNHGLAYLLGTQPNPEMSAFSFFETQVGCVALTGNSYSEIQRDKNGTPIAFWPLHPLKTEPIRNENGTLIYRTSDGMQNSQTRDLAAADVIHVKLFGWDGLRGLSPVGQARQTLGLAVATLKQGARFFGNGSRPGGLLTPKSTLTPEQGNQMRQFWEQQASGVNQGRVAVLPSDWNYTQLGLSLEDSQFLASRGFSRNEIGSIFRIDAHFLGDTTRMSNANHEQSALGLLQDTLQPYIVKFEQEFMRKLLPPTGRVQSQYVIRFDVTERLRTDLKTTLEALAVGRGSGIFSINDGRKWLGMNPIGPEGNVYAQPINTVNAALFVDWLPSKNLSAPPAEKEPKNE